jgi:hypothetical protein
MHAITARILALSLLALTIASCGPRGAYQRHLGEQQKEAVCRQENITCLETHE